MRISIDKRKLADIGESVVGDIDHLLDSIPSYEDGKWRRYGEWGCKMQLLARYWRRFDKYLD